MRARDPSAVVGLVAEDRRLVAPTAHVVGLALLFLVPGLGVAALIEWASTTSVDADALVVTMVVALIAGLVLWRATRIPVDMPRLSIFSIVVWTWITCSVVGALPYVLSDTMFSWQEWDSALFESISGFSCTGSTVLDDIEAHGRGLAMWRQLTQFYGGMGMVVLAVTVLPFLGVGGLELMGAEAPGPASDRLAPRVSETAKRLWVLYAGLTVANAAALFALPRVGLSDGGFGDFVLWPAATQIVLLALMLVGGSIGSTAGGLKVYRVQIATRQIARSLRGLTHPRAVLPLKLGATALPEPVVRRALGFTTAFVLMAGAGVMTVTALGADLVTATGGVLSAMSNMGPALGEAGPDSTFLVYTRPARLVLAGLRLVGRLEIFAILLMFVSGAGWITERTRRLGVAR